MGSDMESNIGQEIKVRLKSGNKVEAIFTDKGNVPSYSDGEFFTSEIQIGDEKYISKTQYELVVKFGNRYRYLQDCYNFSRYGITIIPI